MLKEMGGTPKLTGRTWGDRGGRRSGGQTGLASLSPGRSGEVGGRGPPGSSGRGVEVNCPTLSGTGEPAELPGQSPVIQDTLFPWVHLSWGHRKEAEGSSRETGRRGPPGGRSRGGEEGVCPASSGPGCLLSSPALHDPSPPQMHWSWKHREEAEGRTGEAGGRGPLGWRNREERRSFAPPTRAQEACWGPR